MFWQTAFWLTTLAVCGAPFVPALREWLLPTDAAPLVVVREQDTNIRHFAHSFFDQVHAFFERESIDPLAPPADYAGEFRPGQPVRFLGTAGPPQWPQAVQRARLVSAVLIASGDLMLEGGFVYEHEIYCGGKLYGGAHSTFRAVYAGTDLILGDHCTVARWLHSQGHVHIGRDCAVYGRVSSTSSITIGTGTRFERLNAALIRFASDALVGGGAIMGERRPTPWQAPDRVRSLDDHTVSCRGDLQIDGDTRVESHIVVQGTLELGRLCHLVGNIKAHSGLVLDDGCIVRGALICAGPITVGPGCIVKGPIVSESAISIAAGSIVGTPGLPTSVTAPEVRVEAGCQISGTLWATAEGAVNPAAPANAAS